MNQEFALGVNGVTKDKGLVAPPQVKQALRAAWRGAIEERSREGDNAELKITLSNVLILLDGSSVTDERKNEVEDILYGLCASFPSRAFVISTHPDSEGKLETSVNSRCVKTDSDRTVCSEEVYVSLPTASVNAIPSLLYTLLYPDIPSIVVLLDRPDIISALLSVVLPLTQVAVIDSTRLDKLADLEPLLTEQSAYGTNPPLYDLAWRRLVPWRRLIREQMRGAGTLDQPLEGFGATVTLAPTINSDTLLLAAWLSDICGVEESSLQYAEKGVFTGQMPGGKIWRTTLKVSAEERTLKTQFTGPEEQFLINADRTTTGKHPSLSFCFGRMGRGDRIDVSKLPVRYLPLTAEPFWFNVLPDAASRGRDERFELIVRRAIKLSQLL